MNLVGNILLFLPLCLAICLVSSSLRRDSIAEILRHGTRFFVYLTGAVLVICAVLATIMEYALP